MARVRCGVPSKVRIRQPPHPHATDRLRVRHFHQAVAAERRRQSRLQEPCSGTRGRRKQSAQESVLGGQSPGTRGRPAEESELRGPSQGTKGKPKQSAHESNASAAMEPGLHILVASAGDDVAMMIRSFCENTAPGTFVSVVSAYGTLSNVDVYSPFGGASMEYKGRYEVLSLSVSCTSGNDNSSEPQPLSISIAFCTADRVILCGRVGGRLVAISAFHVFSAFSHSLTADQSLSTYSIFIILCDPFPG